MLIESWKKSLDQKKFVGAFLMDLSKAFDSILHDLPIPKMHARFFKELPRILIFILKKNKIKR